MCIERKGKIVSMRILIIIHGAILVGFFSNENIFLTYRVVKNVTAVKNITALNSIFLNVIFYKQ